MGDGVRPDIAHIVGHHVVPPVEEGARPAQRRQGDARPGAGPLGQLWVVPGGLHQTEDIVQYVLVDKHPAGLGAQLGQLGGVGGLPHLLHGVALQLAPEQVQLVPGLGIAQAQAQGEAVQLGVGQQLGAGGPRRVLGGDDQKGGGHRAGHAVHRHPALLHGLQQGGLGAAGGPVELIGQKQVAQQRAWLVLHLPGGLVVEGKAGEVGGHHIGGELDAVIFQPQGLRKGDGHGGLAHTGDVLQQDMAPGQDGYEDLDHDLILAHHGLLHFIDHLDGQMDFAHGISLPWRGLQTIITKKAELEQPFVLLPKGQEPVSYIEQCRLARGFPTRRGGTSRE